MSIWFPVQTCFHWFSSTCMYSSFPPASTLDFFILFVSVRSEGSFSHVESSTCTWIRITLFWDVQFTYLFTVCVLPLINAPGREIFGKSGKQIFDQKKIVRKTSKTCHHEAIQTWHQWLPGSQGQFQQSFNIHFWVRDVNIASFSKHKKLIHTIIISQKLKIYSD